MRKSRLQTLIEMVKAHGASNKCLVWPYGAFKTKAGFEWYGQVSVNGKKQSCHRAAYGLFVAHIPKGKQVLHTCDRAPCFNPRHLFLGTQADNMADMTLKSRHWLRGIKLLFGEDHPRHALTQKQANTIRAAYKFGVRGRGTRALAIKHGVSKQTIQRVVRRQAYTKC